MDLKYQNGNTEFCGYWLYKITAEEPSTDEWIKKCGVCTHSHTWYDHVCSIIRKIFNLPFCYKLNETEIGFTLSQMGEKKDKYTGSHSNMQYNETKQGNRQ